MFDLQEFIRYGKSRAIVAVYYNGLAFFFVDIIGLMYWQFAIWFVPINWVANYIIFKKFAFKSESKKLFDFKVMLMYARNRAFIVIYSTAFALFFVDLIGLKYWQFAMWFVPINFVVNYFIYKSVFKKKSGT